MGKAAGTGEGDRPLMAVGFEKDACARLAAAGTRSQAQRLSPDELLLLFDALRAEEAGHLRRLRTLQHGLEADRPVAAKWLRSIRRLVPAEYLQ